ncbi:MAG TPA: pilus assembly protein, partial [Rhizobiales bacterium]|nr:pilus assembly protein [Hyphomicrobiales bacterium]
MPDFFLPTPPDKKPEGESSDKSIIEKSAAFLRENVFSRHEKGAVAVEFALILPIMLATYLGVVELSQALNADRKMTRATSAIADLAARSPLFDLTAANNAVKAAEAILAPYDTSTLKFRLSAVKLDTSDGKIKVDWSFAHGSGMSPYYHGQVITTVPNGLMLPDSSLVIAEVNYEYVSPMGDLFSSGVMLTDTFYAYPRKAIQGAVGTPPPPPPPPPP